MVQVVHNGTRFVKGRLYPTIDEEDVIEIKKGVKWELEIFLPGDYTDWDIGFFIAKKFGEFIPLLNDDGDPVLDGNGDPVLVEDRMATGRNEGLSFGDFSIPVLDDNGEPVLDDNGDPVTIEVQDHTYFRLILDSEVTSGMEVAPISYKENNVAPRPGKDYWQGDLELSRTVAGKLEVIPVYFDLTPVVVRGEV